MAAWYGAIDVRHSSKVVSETPSDWSGGYNNRVRKIPLRSFSYSGCIATFQNINGFTTKFDMRRLRRLADHFNIYMSFKTYLIPVMQNYSPPRVNKTSSL